MKSRTLALRVALNSAVMIFLVYVLMQCLVFFRDCFIFGSGSWSDFSSTVFGFVGGRVVPPLILFTVLLWLAALPIQKVAEKLEGGGGVSDAEAEATRRRILRFRTIVLSVNLIGFTVGFLLDLALSGRLAQLVEVHRLTVLGANLCAAFVFSSAQTSLNNVAFADLRDRLALTSIGDRKREIPTTTRQLRLTLALALYAVLVIQYNEHDVTVFQSWGAEVQAQVAAGTLPVAEAPAAYRKIVAERMLQVSTRDPSAAETLVAPWESPSKPWVLEEQVFLVIAFLMIWIAAAVQWAVSREQKATLAALQSRLRDVVAGEGDLRRRLSLRSLDDLGDLADLINQLLTQFQGIVGRIGAAAGQTRDGARAVESVLGRAEEVSAAVGASVAALRADLEDQAAQSRRLTEALGAFRDAARAVDEVAGSQARSVAETSAAMDEMASSIEGVRIKSREAGALTEALSRQGGGGGEAVLQTSEAISAIHRSSLEVLQVLGALKKISADTNLLAMNAAIEAAHAGDKGAGFAVVADEVRKLATTASSQTKAIKDLIQAMARQVDAGVDRARVSGSVLADLVKGLEDSAQVSRAVAEAMEEQAGRTQSVGDSLTQVVQTSDTIRQKMAVQAETTDQMAQGLGQALGRLGALVEASHRQAEAVAGLEASFAEVRREVDRNARAAETLQAEVERFRV